MNVAPMTQHLTEDQLEDLLLGEETHGAADHLAAHLAGCPHCRARQDVFLASLDSFNQATQDWAQARSNSLPLHPAAATAGLFRSPSWAMAAALLFFTLLLSYVGFHPRATPEQARQAAPAIQQLGTSDSHSASDNQIASDNVLLADIDAALGQPEPAVSVLFGQPAQPDSISTR